MKVTCPRDMLLEKLQTVLKTVATKSTMPILSGIMIRKASDESLELSSTNMELSLRMMLNAGIEGDGSTVVPGRLFTDVVRSLPQGDVMLEFNEADEAVNVVSGTASFSINCMPAADFPRLPGLIDEDAFEIDSAPLVDTITTVAKAASRDETRPVLTGMLVKFSSNRIKIVATDSYRLSIMEEAATSSLSEKKEVIVPRSALEELARLCSFSGSGKVKVSIMEGQVLFGVDDIVLASRLIEGQFPNYQQLLPEEFKHEIKIDKEELLEVVGRIGLMAQKNAPLRITLSDGEMKISAQTPQVGEAKETLPVQFQGEELEIGFNPEFLRDGIDSVGGKEAVLRIISPLRPGLLKGSGDDFLYLIMPVRLTG